MIHSSTANIPPGLTHRKPPVFAFGDAQYRIANIRLTSTISTGHFAMLQTVTTAAPQPYFSATASASPPVKTTIATEAISITPTTAVTPTRIGSVFQIGRPSGTSYTAFEARMNAAMYPDADQNAVTRPMIAAIPAAPEPCTC